MGAKANPTLIGLFVIGALALITAAVLIFGGGWLFTETNTYVLYFSGSVNGLNVGAPVKFRGVQIGKVSDIRALFDAEDYSAYIRVLIEVDPDRFSEIKQGVVTSATTPDADEIQALIDQGLRGQLQLQSYVTGLLYIEFDFRPGTPTHLAGLDDKYPELPTIPTTMEELFATLRRAMEQLDELQLDQVLSEVKSIIQSANAILSSPDIQQSLQALRRVLEKADWGLEHIVAQMPQILQNTNKATQTAQDALGTLNATLMDAQQVVERIDGEIEPLLGYSQETLTAARQTLEQVHQTLATLEASSTPAIEQAERAFASITDFANAESAALRPAIEEIESAARAIRVLAEYLQRNPAALLRGRSR